MRQDVLGDHDRRQVKQFHPPSSSGDLGFPLEILCQDLNDVFCCQPPLFTLHPLSLCLVVINVELAGHAEPDIVLLHFSSHRSSGLVFDDPPEPVISLLNLKVTFERQVLVCSWLGLGG